MRAVILGVNGVTGRAIAHDFACAGWSVMGTGQDPARFPRALREHGVEFVRSDRHDPAALRAALAGGGDVVVDCLCYTAEHARQLLRHRADFGSAVVLSSKAVYVDDQGRHSNSDAPPCFPAPVTEHQPVLGPDYSGAFDSREGYGPNKVAAEHALQESGWAVSILRASRVYGPGARPPREWFVVKRLLDGRRQIPLAHGGQTANHPTGAANLARLVRACAQQPGRRVLNAADPGRPTACAIVEAIAAACACPVEIIGLDEDAPPQWGWTPWATWPAFFLDTTAAAALGYRPAGTYADAVRPAVHELLSLSQEEQRRWERDAYFADRFDYRLDDAALLLAAS